MDEITAAKVVAAISETKAQIEGMNHMRLFALTNNEMADWTEKMISAQHRLAFLESALHLLPRLN